MITALLVVTVAGAHVGSAVVARHRAQSAADLAALAAAASVVGGPESACARATVLARAMATEAVACTLDGLDVVVTVEASAALGLRGWPPARAVAKAGPALPDAGHVG